MNRTGILFAILAWIVTIFGASDASAAVRINTITSANTTVSTPQSGIVVNMEVENLGAATTITAASLSFSLGSYEQNLVSPSLGSTLPAGGKVTFLFAVVLTPLAPSGLCTVDGYVNTSSEGSDNSADLKHSWVVQQPSELVITQIQGAAEVTRGSTGNLAIMDISRTGEADVSVTSADLQPWLPPNYANWRLTQPELPQTFAKPSWWDTRWGFRKVMTIANRSPSILPTTYEIKVTFDHSALVAAGKSRADGNDVRIVYNNGSFFQELDRYLDRAETAWGSQTTSIWFRLQAPLGAAPQTTSSYALYYGYPGAGAPPANPNNVFIFNDDCEGADPGYTIVTTAGTAWLRGMITLPNPGGQGQYPPNLVYWPTTTAYPRSLTQCWETGAGNYAGNTNASVFSPARDLTGKLNPTLSFWNWVDVEQSGSPWDYGVLRVYQAPYPGAVVSTLLDKYCEETGIFGVAGSGFWRQESGVNRPTFKLDPTWGNIYLGWQFISDPGSHGKGWCVDEIRIRQIAVPEPNNPGLGVEEKAPTVPTIKTYFDIDVAANAVAGNDTVDGKTAGSEFNTGNSVSAVGATLPLTWLIRGQNFFTYGNNFYASPKDTFNIGETVYGKGTGYSTGTVYLIRWLNPSGAEISRTSAVPGSDGSLAQSRTMLGNDLGGKWTVQVENLAGTQVFAVVYFNLNTTSQLVSEIIVPEKIVEGQSFSVTEKITNTGQTPAIGVSPSPLSASGAATVNLVGGPNPSASSIAGGEVVPFTWTYTATSGGRKWFRGNAAGTVQGTTNQAVSAPVTSNIVLICSQSAVIASVSSPVTTVNRGQTDVPVSLTIINSGTADLALASLSFIVRQGATDHSDDFSATILAPPLPATVKPVLYPPWAPTMSGYAYRQKLQMKSGNQLYSASCTAWLQLKTAPLVPSKMLASRNDLCILRWDDPTQSWAELDRHYVDPNNTAFCIRQDIQPYDIDESYYVYYGNPGAGAPPANRNLCYLFFEDWETTVAAARLNAAIRGAFPRWVFSENIDGIYLTNAGAVGNQTRTMGLSRCRFPANPPFTGPFNSFSFRFDLRNYPAAVLDFFYCFTGGVSWNSTTNNWNWTRVRYFDGVAPTSVLELSSAGQANGTLSQSAPYYVPASPLSANASFSFEANFYYSAGFAVYYDDIRLRMDAPTVVPMGEETKAVDNSLAVTLGVDIAGTAPSGNVTLDATATLSSPLNGNDLLITGSLIPGTWNIGTPIIQTYADAMCTTTKSEFSTGQTAYVNLTGLAPGGYTVRWLDAYPSGGNVVKTSANQNWNPGNTPPGFAAPGQFSALATSGAWLIQVINFGSGVQVATASFQVTEPPVLVPSLTLSPATTTVGEIITAKLNVVSAIDYENFESFAVGAVPAATWTVTAGVTVDATAINQNNPPSKSLKLTGTSQTRSAVRKVRLDGVYQPVLNLIYSTVFANPSTFRVEVSPDAGGTWNNVSTITASLGAGAWTTLAIPLPSAIENKRSAQLRISLIAGAGVNSLFIDELFITGQSARFEPVILAPERWASSSAGTGNSISTGDPTPPLTTLPQGGTVTFEANYINTVFTTVGTNFYLHGPQGVRVASGASAIDGDSCNATETLSNGIKIYNAALAVSPSLIDLGTVLPGNTAAAQNLTITNTGNIQLDHVTWELHTLSTDSNFIPYEAITMNPSPVSVIANPGNKLCSATITVPPATPVGTYSAVQFAFEDNDLNGVSAGEPIGSFTLRVYVPPKELLLAATNSINMGTWLNNDQTATFSLLVSNSGNVKLDYVRFVVPNHFWRNGTDSTRIIASSNVSLNPFFMGTMSSADSKNQMFSVKVTPTPMNTGTYIATAAFINDLNTNAKWDTGEASSVVMLTLVVSNSETFTVASAPPIDLGNTGPGQFVSTGTIRVNNTGAMPLSNIRFNPRPIFQNTGESIPSSSISFAPDPLPIVAVGGSQTFRVFLYVPFGQASSTAGDYYGRTMPISSQYLYNDKNLNGSWDTGEASVALQLKLVVGRAASFTVSDGIANFGSGLPGVDVTAAVDVISIGNATCTGMTWVVTSASGSNCLTSGAASMNFNPAVAGTFNPSSVWSLGTPPGTTHRMATLTLSIPGAQQPGTYLGKCRLYNDANTNATFTAGECFQDFDLQVEVGGPAVDIPETSPFNLGSFPPYSTSTPKNFTVRNSGQVTLINLKYDIPASFTDGMGHTMATSAIVFSPNPLGLLYSTGIGAPTVRVNIPANQPPGIYTTNLYVYEDDNNDGKRNAGETFSTVPLTLQIEVLTARVMSFTPSPIDMGGIQRNSSLSKSFSGRNLGNLDLTQINTIKSNLVDGANTILSTAVNLVFPETPWQIPCSGTTLEIATISVTTTPTTPTGNYKGTVTLYEDINANGNLDSGENNWVLPVKASVGDARLNVLQSQLDFSVVAKGATSANLKLSAQAIGTLNLSNVCVLKSPLIGPGSIPVGNSTIPAFGPITAGAIRDVWVNVAVPANATSGIYTADQKVYEDSNMSGSPEPGDASDTFNIRILVNAGGAFGYEVIADPYLIDFGVIPRNSGVATRSFKLQSLAGSALTNMQFIKSDLTNATSTLAMANLGLTPVSSNIPMFQILPATATLSIPTFQPAGTYTGIQSAKDLGGTPASATFSVTVVVPPVSFSAAPSSIDFGTVAPGMSATATTVISNTSLERFTTDWSKSDFLMDGIGPAHIPSASYSFSLPFGLALQAPPAMPNAYLATVSLNVGPGTPPGLYIATITVVDDDFPSECLTPISLQVKVIPGGPPSPAVSQEIATTTFDGSRFIFSAWVCPGTGTAGIGFSAFKNFHQISVATAGLVINAGGLSSALPGNLGTLGTIAEMGVCDTISAQHPDYPTQTFSWYRLYIAFDATFDPSVASSTWLMLFNQSVSGSAVWFDGVQLEKAVFQNQTRPTAYGAGRKIVSPNPGLDISGEKRIYQW